MHEVTVRAETPEDIRAIDVVHLSAFAGESEANLVRALRESDRFLPDLSLVAEVHGRIVGHVVLSRARLESDSGAREVLVLGPMSVVPSQSHRGIGSALVRAAVDRGRAHGYGAIVVAGFPDYYRRFGFEPMAKWGLDCSLSIPEYAVTAMELAEGALAGGGRVVYPAEFTHVFQPG
ncbi:MAG: N-acetyltransferase [Gammaproteobacteria bacterium]|nr:N-acetyltransferase [Gammaproteobacteria bacterium]